MSWKIGIMALVLTVISVSDAQDGEREKRLAEIKKLEQRAEKLLDQGRRTEAFDALARAALLRDNLKSPQRGRKKPKSDKPKAKGKAGKRGPSDLQKASAALSKALESGNMQGVNSAAKRFQAVALQAEKRHRAQMAAARKDRNRLEARLKAIEDSVAELRKALR